MTTLENEKNVNGVEESKRAEMHKTYGMWYKGVSGFSRLASFLLSV